MSVALLNNGVLLARAREVAEISAPAHVGASLCPACGRWAVRIIRESAEGTGKRQDKLTITPLSHPYRLCLACWWEQPL